MRIGHRRMKRRVWVTAACVVVSVAAWWLWTRANQSAAVGGAKTSEPFVRLAGSGGNPGERELQERAEYFDPTPLFFPTEHNFGQGVSPERARRQPGQVFASYDAKLRFAESAMPTYGQETVATAERLGDVLVQGNEAPFAGFGMIEDTRASLSERSAFMEVKTLYDGKTIVAQALKRLVLPRSDFGPLEFLVLVGRGGVIGDPVLIASSEREEVDGFFRDYLVQSFRIGERVSPGRYRVVIGP